MAEIAHVGAIANRYRFHGANMGLGVTPERRVAIYRMELPWRRWMMRHLVEDDTVSVDDVGAALQAWRLALREATSGEPGGARALLGGDREAAGDLAPPIGPLAPSSKALLRARFPAIRSTARSPSTWRLRCSGSPSCRRRRPRPR